MSKLKKPWRIVLQKILYDSAYGNDFGYNFEINIEKHLLKLEKLDIANIQIPNAYTIKFDLPKLKTNQIKILMYILEQLLPSSFYQKTHKNITTLTLEFHF